MDTWAVIRIVVTVLCAALIAVVVRLARAGRLSRTALLVSGCACAAALLAMLLSDWALADNLGWNDFWSTHSVMAGFLSSVLLVGVVFIFYERAESERQEELANGLSSAGLGGIVDHMIDVEVALALLSEPCAPHDVNPKWTDWDQGKPLRWLREDRDATLIDGRDSATPDAPGSRDPRRHPVTAEALGDDWSSELVDQCIRRILVAMRDWSVLVNASNEGTSLLLELSEIRRDLMAVSTRTDDAPGTDIVRDVRIKVRGLAAYFEARSLGAVDDEVLFTAARRPELLFVPVPESSGHEVHFSKLKLSPAVEQDVESFMRRHGLVAG